MGSGFLEQLGEEAQKKAIKLSIEGLSATAICDELNKEFSATLTTQNVQAFLSRKQNKRFDILKEDKKFQNKLIKQYFDTIEQLTNLNNEMWKFFYEIRKDPEFSSKQVYCPECNYKFTVQLKSYGTLLKTAEHLLHQIRHVDEVLGKMSKKSLTVTYNYVDLSQKLQKILPEIYNKSERLGDIVIKKKKKFRVQ